MKKKMKKREKTKRELRIAHKGTSFVCPQTDRGLFSSLRITYNSILLALFYRKSQDNEIKVWSKALLVGEGWKENKIDECSTTLQTEKLHLFSLKPILSSYYSVTAVSSNISGKAKTNKWNFGENKVEDCSTALQTEKLHLFALKPIGDYLFPLLHD